jgi:AhpD family alkylhydroperoxidase
MNRLQQIENVHATGEYKPDLLAVKRQFGVVANAIRVLGNSPAAINGYLCLQAALSGGVLSTKIRAQIALAVSEINGSSYCLSAYTVSARRAGLSGAEIGAARFGSGSDKKSEAVLDLVWAILMDKGQIADSDLESARNAGLSDEEIVEVVANIALTTFTNFVNEVATTVIDFPEVTPGIVALDPLQNASFSDTGPQPQHGDI